MGYLEAKEQGAHYTYQIQELDIRKLLKTLGYDGHEGHTCDLAVDIRILDSNPEFKAEYDLKLGAVSYYEEGVGGYRHLFITDLLEECGITLKLEWDKDYWKDRR